MPRYILLFLIIVAGTFRSFGEDEVTLSPNRTFRIVQNQTAEGWSETLHFQEPAQDIVLEREISWPAVYYISPDEHWILRVQKSGAGDNISILYQVEMNQSVWRMEEQIGQLGFAFLAHRSGGLSKGLYHTGIEFTSWDLKRERLQFTIHGSADENGHGIEQSLIYNLAQHRIELP